MNAICLTKLVDDHITSHIPIIGVVALRKQLEGFPEHVTHLFPHPNSTGLSSGQMQMLHSMSVFVCTCVLGIGVEEKNKAGAIVVSIDTTSLTVPIFGLPG